MTIIVVCVSVLCYAAYGDDVSDNILFSVPHGPGRVVSEVFLVLHLIGEMVIVGVPMLMNFESNACLNISSKGNIYIEH